MMFCETNKADVGDHSKTSSHITMLDNQSNVNSDMDSIAEVITGSEQESPLSGT